MPDLSTDHSSATLEGAHSHGARRAYVSSRADRPTSFDPADIPVPAGREEEWRFTPMRRFRPLFDLDAVRAWGASVAVESIMFPASVIAPARMLVPPISKPIVTGVDIKPAL